MLGDVLVLAGDVLPIRRPPHVREMLGWFCLRFPRVVYVPGNHEYYKTSPAAGAALLATCAEDFPNLTVLDAAVAEIEGTRFVGTTLWFPPTPDEEDYRRFLADFSLIESFVPWVHEAHARNLAFLEQEVRPGDVVVTHFLPHPQRGSAVPGNARTASFSPAMPRRWWRSEAPGCGSTGTHVASTTASGDAGGLQRARLPRRAGHVDEPELVIEV